MGDILILRAPEVREGTILVLEAKSGCTDEEEEEYAEYTSV